MCVSEKLCVIYQLKNELVFICTEYTIATAQIYSEFDILIIAFVQLLAIFSTKYRKTFKVLFDLFFMFYMKNAVCSFKCSAFVYRKASKIYHLLYFQRTHTIRNIALLLTRD